MRVIRGLVVRGGTLARPAAKAIGRSTLAANRGGAVTVLSGDPDATTRLLEITGVTRSDDTGQGLMVFAAVPHADLVPAARRLGDHRRAGGRALALAVGTPSQRRRTERVLLDADADLSAATLAHVDDLADAKPVLAAISRALGGERVAAAKAVPAIRSAVADTLVAGSSRRAALVAATPVLAPVALPVLTGMQLRLAADLSNASGRPLDGRIAGQSAGVMTSAFAWREVARRLSRRAPSAAPAIRAGVAYAATRGVGLVSGRLGASRSRPSKGES